MSQLFSLKLVLDQKWINSFKGVYHPSIFCQSCLNLFEKRYYFDMHASSHVHNFSWFWGTAGMANPKQQL